MCINSTVIPGVSACLQEMGEMQAVSETVEQEGRLSQSLSDTDNPATAPTLSVQYPDFPNAPNLPAYLQVLLQINYWQKLLKPGIFST